MDGAVWISRFSTFCNSVGVDPGFAFMVLVIGPILLLAWWGNTKNDKKLTHKVYEIRTTPLPEKMEFFYKPFDLVVWGIFGVIVPCLLWHYVFLRFFSASGRTYFLVSYIFFMILGLLIAYARSRYVNKPAVVLSREGIKYIKQFYSWDVIEKIEVVHPYKSSPSLVLGLKPEAQRYGLQEVSIELGFGGFQQKWLPEYAKEYFLRGRK